MKIHEYQGKSILKSYGVAIQEGIVAETPEQAVAAAKQVMETYKCEVVVMKGQIKVGLRDFQCRKVAFNLGLSGNAFKEMTKFVASLYKAYDSIDSSMFEINPVLKTSDDKIIAVDAKVTIDENALYRHKDIEAMRD